MKHGHDRRSPRRRVAEPVQVYLDRADRERLERLVERLDTTKSEVLRRGLEALDRQLSDPASHPALRIIGLAAGLPRRMPPDAEVAREHDRFLAQAERSKWQPQGGTGHGP